MKKIVESVYREPRKPLRSSSGKKRMSKEKRRAIFYFVMYGLYLGTFVPLLFQWADMLRGYDATGGEALMIFLPLILYGYADSVRNSK